MSCAFGESYVLLVTSDHSIKNALTTSFQYIRGKVFWHLLDGGLFGRFEEIKYRLDGLSFRERINTVCLVDLTQQAPGIGDAEQLVKPIRPAQLALLYPEVYFIFLVYKLPTDYSDPIVDYHFVEINTWPRVFELIKRHNNGFRNWYDASGLRSFLRKDNEKKKLNLAGAIDEEKACLLMNGYTLYRWGYRAHVVATKAEMKRLFDNDAECFDLIFEDLDLRFPDLGEKEGVNLGLTPPNESTSNKQTEYKTQSDCIKACLKNRATNFCKLSKDNNPALKRILVSSRKIGKDLNDKEQKNHGLAAELTKPYCGHFDPKLREVLRPDDCLGEILRRSREEKKSVRHGSPYERQFVAEALIDRSHNLYSEDATVDTAVHGALLVRDALILLKGNTMVLSLEALSLLHQHETQAECAFSGVGGILDATVRIQELEGHAEIIVKEGARTHTAVAEIVNRLRRIYAHFGRYDEEEASLQKVRDATTRMRPCLFCNLFAYYYNYLLRGLLNIILVDVLYVVSFAFILVKIDSFDSVNVGNLFDHSWLSLKISASAFFLADPGSGFKFANSISQPIISAGTTGLVILEGILGLLHVGILISYLYQKASRR
ncbi:MAG TPA: hypothetical protein ENI68_11235 [Gammaproteobacteria bacterium]|nr:hypothetical protein [Gammaproteobacteria bacterium]